MDADCVQKNRYFANKLFTKMQMLCYNIHVSRNPPAVSRESG